MVIKLNKWFAAAALLVVSASFAMVASAENVGIANSPKQSFVLSVSFAMEASTENVGITNSPEQTYQGYKENSWVFG